MCLHKLTACIVLATYFPTVQKLFRANAMEEAVNLPCMQPLIKKGLLPPWEMPRLHPDSFFPQTISRSKKTFPNRRDG